MGAISLRWILAISEAPPWLDPSLDWRVIGFTLAISFIAAILFGLTPALQLAKQRQRAVRMRQFLIGAQVAASCVLVIVAGLLVRALNHAMVDDPGFDYAKVVSVDPRLSNYGYSPEQARAYFEQLRQWRDLASRHRLNRARTRSAIGRHNHHEWGPDRRASCGDSRQLG